MPEFLEKIKLQKFLWFFELKTGVFIAAIASLIFGFLAVLGDIFYLLGLVDCAEKPQRICSYSTLRKQKLKPEAFMPGNVFRVFNHAETIFLEILSSLFTYILPLIVVSALILLAAQQVILFIFTILPNLNQIYLISNLF